MSRMLHQTASAIYFNAKPSGLTGGCPRMLHTISAQLFTPNRNAQPVYKQVKVTVGQPEDNFAMFEPSIGSVLAGKDLNTGERHEIQLTFFHAERYFARGKSENCARLHLDMAFGSDGSAKETPSTLFHGGGFLSTIALNGTEDESFVRVMGEVPKGIEKALAELKNR